MHVGRAEVKLTAFRFTDPRDRGKASWRGYAALTIAPQTGTIVRMKIVADTNTFLAVALDEPERPRIIDLALGHDLIAPEILPFEIGNALTAMMKKGTLRPHQVTSAWDAVQVIAVELRAIDIRSALGIAIRFGIYAYDAYFLECALSLRLPLLTLDAGMRRVARELSIQVLE